jgi:hypothetical protein
MEGALILASKGRADALQKLEAQRRNIGGPQGTLGDFAKMFGKGHALVTSARLARHSRVVGAPLYAIATWQITREKES